MTFTLRQKVDTTMQLHNGIITILSHLLKMWGGVQKISDCSLKQEDLGFYFVMLHCDYGRIYPKSNEYRSGQKIKTKDSSEWILKSKIFGKVCQTRGSPQYRCLVMEAGLHEHGTGCLSNKLQLKVLCVSPLFVLKQKVLNEIQQD